MVIHWSRLIPKFTWKQDHLSSLLHLCNKTGLVLSHRACLTPPLPMSSVTSISFNNHVQFSNSHSAAGVAAGVFRRILAANACCRRESSCSTTSSGSKMYNRIITTEVYNVCIYVVRLPGKGRLYTSTTSSISYQFIEITTR